MIVSDYEKKKDVRGECVAVWSSKCEREQVAEGDVNASRAAEKQLSVQMQITI